MRELGPQQRARVFAVLGGVLLSCAVIGFFLEVNRPRPVSLGYTEAAPLVLKDVPRARSYSDLRRAAPPDTQALYLAAAATLRAQLPALGAVVQPQTAAEREQALAQRAQRRAYEGAPPTVPHPVDQRAMPNCLVCHERGAKVGDLIAPAISHPVYVGCHQCHVSQSRAPGLQGSAAPEPPASVAPTLADVPNDFEPVATRATSTRAWAGAPPTMPHSAWMRDHCASCHGVSGKAGLRTTHPERQNCPQCHAPQAVLEANMHRFSARGPVESSPLASRSP